MQEAELPTETLISIIDDDEDFREAIARPMKSRGFTVDAFPSALAFLSCPNIAIPPAESWTPICRE